MCGRIENRVSSIENRADGRTLAALPFDFTGHGNKANRDHRTFVKSIGGPRDDLQLLVEITDWDHHPRAYGELLEQRVRHPSGAAVTMMPSKGASSGQPP